MTFSDVIDWPLARRVARVASGSGPAVTPQLRESVREDFRRYTALSDRLVRDFTGIEPADPMPEPRVLGRDGWVAANAESFASMIRPFADKVAHGVGRGVVGRRLTSAALGVQMGLLLGYLSQKVLGQYDLMLAGESGGRVYYVGPNVVEAERRWGLDPADFRLWISLHEVTHRTQFTGVPWLRARVRGLLERAVAAVDLDPERVRRIVERGRDLLLAGPAAWQRADIAALLLSDEQREVIGEMQALMTVVEGHGNFVMNRVGAERIPTYDVMRRAVEQRRSGAGGPERVFQRAIGMSMKYEQYVLGERFMDEVADRAGIGAVNLIWVREQNLPTLEDLRAPDRWLGRVGA